MIIHALLDISAVAMFYLKEITNFLRLKYNMQQIKYGFVKMRFLTLLVEVLYVQEISPISCFKRQRFSIEQRRNCQLQ
jgi:hypothetical protein